MSPHIDAPELATVVTYAAVVDDDGAIVLDESYDTPSARRDAVIDLLLSNHDEVEQSAIDEILAPYGGANADSALALVVELFVNAHVNITVHLTERTQNDGPAKIYTAFTDHGDGNTVIEHYATQSARLAQLRLRAASVATADYADNFFDDADEETCRKVLEYHVTANNGRVYLMDAARQEADYVFIGYRQAA